MSNQLGLPDFISSRVRPNCEVCFGLGIVCEDHPLRPWDSGTEYDCLCGAAGMPCVCTGLTSGAEVAA